MAGAALAGVVAILVAVALAAGGCSGRPGTSGPATTVELVLEGAAPAPTAASRLRFSGPVDPSSVDEHAVLLVPYADEGRCTVDLGCRSPARCRTGRCQRERVDASFLADAATAPLSHARAALRVPLALELSADGRALAVRPQVPLPARRWHTLIVTARLRDAAGRPLVAASRDSAAGGRRGIALVARFVSGSDASASPRLVLESPADGQTDLPPNLARLVLRATRPLVGVKAGQLSLVAATSASGAAVPLVPRVGDPRCAVEPGGRCFVVAPAWPLPPLAELTLHVGGAVRGADGRALFRGRAARIGSAGRADTRAPQLSGLAVFVADGCVVVRVRSDEVGDAWLRADVQGAGRRVVTSLGRTRHELALRLAAGQRARLAVEVADLAGNVARRELSVRGPSRDRGVVITEVMFNPRGREPAQEWVELTNRGANTVQLGGLVIDDGDDGVGARVLPQGLLRPGQRALVVGARYDARGDADAQPRAGTLIVRLDGPIGELGLANDGELVVLRDADGQLVSSYGGHHASRGRGDDGVSVERVSLTGCDVASSWRRRDAGSTPGW